MFSASTDALTTLWSFSLANSHHHNILIGTIERTELIAAIERQIGRDRRIKVALAKRFEESMNRKREEERRRMEYEQEMWRIKLEEESRERTAELEAEIQRMRLAKEKEHEALEESMKNTVRNLNLVLL